MESMDMTDREIWQELMWDKIQRGDYIVQDSMVYEYETGEFICHVNAITA